jgi:hypothetical protein
MAQSRARVLNACKAAGVASAGQVFPDTVVQYIDEGLMVGVGLSRDVVEMGRRHTKRSMPW